MQGARHILCGVLVLSGCGGGSPAGSDAGAGTDGGPDTGDQAPRQWERQFVQENGSYPDIAISGSGTVDIVSTGSAEGDYGIVWQQLGGEPELVAAASQIEGYPRVARDSAGAVHVVWGTGLTSGEVHYAVRTETGWTTETIATDRYRPDIAIAPDDTVHIAFVDETTGDAMAYHATPDTEGWQITPVHGTRWNGDSQVAIALTPDGHPVLAARDSESAGIWLATADGAGDWTVETLATDRTTTAPIDLAIDSTGTAVAFKDGSHTIVAWRPTNSDTWSIEEASRHDAADRSLNVAIGPTGPLVVSDVDVEYPNGTALLEPVDSDWTGQLLGPASCGESGQALAIDPAGEPAIAITCNFDGIFYMTVTGRYPDDWPDRCSTAAEALCEQACTCGIDGEDCCWGLGNNYTCTSNFGCPSNATASLCADPTADPSDLQACRDELSSLTCSAEGPLDLDGACAPLYDPFP